jgi:hypothetical protein
MDDCSRRPVHCPRACTDAPDPYSPPSIPGDRNHGLISRSKVPLGRSAYHFLRVNNRPRIHGYQCPHHSDHDAGLSKLIPIVTTASSVDPLELVHVCTHRWPAQENNLRDFLLTLGLDTNHGYAKQEVADKLSPLQQRKQKAEEAIAAAFAACERACQRERDLAVLSQRVKAAPPRLPDGRRLVLRIAGGCCLAGVVRPEWEEQTGETSLSPLA